jgi:hypothetical protein
MPPAPSPAVPRGDRRNPKSREDLLRRVCGEFVEMPCLRLTRAQAQRLFALRADVCDRVLAQLIFDGTLALEGDDKIRLSDRAWATRSAFRKECRPSLPSVSSKD